MTSQLFGIKLHMTCQSFGIQLHPTCQPLRPLDQQVTQSGNSLIRRQFTFLLVKNTFFVYMSSFSDLPQDLPCQKMRADQTDETIVHQVYSFINLIVAHFLTL
jgi:hypothetical protein